MKIEEAILIAEDNLKLSKEVDECSDYEETVLKTLQEKQEREKGCDRCKTGVYMTNSVAHPQYKFCPMCGRKLDGGEETQK